ncbi:unnamed protein product [Prorocentrum cordatum]|uniref:RING-type domain-containing protein n=1 Tax=Prorocentrum cordatum TaxID=2364126 RepID=A0ABN9VKA4_9DINO|nr:unnamed protein product [Polarella glacialis]
MAVAAEEALPPDELAGGGAAAAGHPPCGKRAAGPRAGDAPDGVPGACGTGDAEAPLDPAPAPPPQPARRVLRAAVSDPMAHFGSGKLPPWLSALEEEAGLPADGGAARLAPAGCPSLPGSPRSSRAEEEERRESVAAGQAAADAELALAAPDEAAPPAVASATGTEDRQGSDLTAYCGMLEQRVAQLRLALRHSEAANAALLRRLAGSDGAHAPGAGAGPPAASARPEAMPCCICLSAQSEWAFTPCGHRCVCRLCGISAVRTDRRCPICRAVSGRVLRIVDP